MGISNLLNPFYIKVILEIKKGIYIICQKAYLFLLVAFALILSLFLINQRRVLNANPHTVFSLPTHFLSVSSV